ncbi:tumor necrosis factor receptor superfamily member 5-like isoform X2 [Stigmatopora argus]
MVLGNNQLTVHRMMIVLIYVFRTNTLECHQTQFQRDENQCCSKCPIGTHVRNDCTKYGSTSCQLCVKNTFMNIPTGLKYCFPCTNCTAGFGLEVKRECTGISDALCKPLDGFFCLDTVAKSCLHAQKHKICQPGQYISQKGTPFNDTICLDCSNETFSTGNFTVCQPHKKCDSEDLLIDPGTMSTDAKCGRKLYRLFIIAFVVWLFCVLVIGVCVKKGNQGGGDRNIRRKPTQARGEL